MIEAFRVADLGCIRYKGRDRVIQIRLIGHGEGAQCDALPGDLQAQHNEMSARRITAEYGRNGEELPKPLATSMFEWFKKWFGPKS
jgi:hypothetical protein